MTASLVRHLGDCGADLVKDVFQASPVLSCEGAGIGLSGFNLGSEAAVQFALVNQFALVLIRASRQTGLVDRHQRAVWASQYVDSEI